MAVPSQLASTPSRAVATIDSINPATQEINAQFAVTLPAELPAIFARARSAQKDWSARPLRERCAMLRPLRDALSRRGSRWRAGVFGTYDGFYTEMFALSAGQARMIDGMREEIRRLGLIATDMETATLLTAGRVLGAHGDAQRTRDLFPELGQAQAAFAAALLSFGADDLGIHQHQSGLGIFLEGNVDDGQALGDADLRRRQAYAVRRVHGLEHVLDQLAQSGVEDGDGFRRFLQNRVAIFDDGIDHQEQLSVASSQLSARIISNP